MYVKYLLLYTYQNRQILYFQTVCSVLTKMVIIGKINLYVHSTIVTRQRTNNVDILQKDKVSQIRSSIILSVLLKTSPRRLLKIRREVRDGTNFIIINTA